MIKKYKDFLKESIDDDVEMVKNYTMDVYNGESWSGFEYDDIEDRLVEFAQEDFPYGLQNIPNPLILYRLLNVGDINDINKQKLGKSFVGDKDMFDDEDFLYSASILSGNDPIKKWFIVTVETIEDNLDIYDMLGNRAEYPNEYEFSLKNTHNLKILNIEEMDNSLYKD